MQENTNLMAAMAVTLSEEASLERAKEGDKHVENVDLEGIMQSPSNVQEETFYNPIDSQVITETMPEADLKKFLEVSNLQDELRQ